MPYRLGVAEAIKVLKHVWKYHFHIVFSANKGSHNTTSCTYMQWTCGYSVLHILGIIFALPPCGMASSLKTYKFNDMFLLHTLGHLRTQVTFSFSIEGVAFVCLHLKLIVYDVPDSRS
jgi:hypothetical protein